MKRHEFLSRLIIAAAGIAIVPGALPLTPRQHAVIYRTAYHPIYGRLSDGMVEFMSEDLVPKSLLEFQNDIIMEEFKRERAALYKGLPKGTSDDQYQIHR